MMMPSLKFLPRKLIIKMFARRIYDELKELMGGDAELMMEEGRSQSKFICCQLPNDLSII